MKAFSILKRISAIVCAAALAAALIFTVSGCGCSKEKNAAVITESNPYALADPGKLTEEGYQLPYQYDDGYKAIVPTVEDSQYFTASKTPAGNMTFHLTTSKSEEEVKKFYEKYFANLQKVKAKKATDTSEGYFDKDRRVIVFNLNVWTADGKTNYKLGAEACDRLEDSKVFEAVK